MKWFWQRKKPVPQPVAPAPDAPARERRTTSPRAARRTAPLAPGALEPRNEVLAFARDTLNAQGARVQMEEDDLVIAIFPDTAPARYTTSITRARAEDDVTLLTQGAPALAAIFEVAEARARLSAVTLTATGDPAALALRALTPSAGFCGRCAGGDPHAAHAAGRPLCDTCPLRSGGLALRAASAPTRAVIHSGEDELSVELTYRVSGHDRRGRRDEWLRLAFSAGDGAQLPPLAVETLATATPTSDSDATIEETIASAATRATTALRPGAEALAAYLAARVEAEFQRRIEDVTVTHERVKREGAHDEVVIASSLARDLSSLADVYGVGVEAALESVCIIHSPLARVHVEWERGAETELIVDSGRGEVRPPSCAHCGALAMAGRICAAGHVVCAACAQTCARCGAVRCAVCAVEPLTPCALCREPLCRDCVRSCDVCGAPHCASHLWTCAEGDQTLCLYDLTPCAECQTPLCEAHALACTVCGQRHCTHHTRVCKTGGEALCAIHAASCVTCHHALCDAHLTRCEACAQSVCTDDLLTCAGCGRALCACSDLTPCATCGALYCASCHAGSASCPACRALSPASAADLELLRLAAAAEPAISLKRAWVTGQNARGRVYVSRGLGREEAYVIDNQGAIIASRRKGWRAG